MKQLRISFLMMLVMTCLTGLIYPLTLTFISQFTMPKRANGSLIQVAGKIVGSELIAQNFKKDSYFWPRPSAIEFDPMKPSGGSNLGPTSKILKALVETRVKAFSSSPPAELIYASGSGLDPHISLETAYFQSDRIAKTRSATKSEIDSLILSLKEGVFHDYVNVLLLNLALDRKYPMEDAHGK